MNTHIGSSFDDFLAEEAVRKTLLRGDRTISAMAEQLNVPYHSLKHWLRKPNIIGVRPRI